MRRTREFRNIFFTSEGIEKAFKFFDKSLLTDLHKRYLVKELVIELGELSWEFDTDEGLLRAYIPGITTIIYKKTFLDYEFMLYTAEHSTYVGLKAQTLAMMVPIFQYVEGLVPYGALTREEALRKAKPLVLVLHGKDDSWKELVTYLYVRHGLAVKPMEMSMSNLTLLDEIIRIVEKGNLMVFAMVGQMSAADREADELSNRIANMVGYDHMILLYSGAGIEKYWPSELTAIEYRQGHIKQVFWSVLNLIRQRFTKGETEHFV